MATIKSYTDIEKSRKLAEILPLESADMVYTITNGYHTPWIRIEKIDELDKDDVCAWSLAALLNILPKSLIYTPNQALDGYCCKNITHDLETYGDNPVDACVAMIEKLHELKML